MSCACVTFCVLVCCECGLLVHRVTRPLRGSVSCVVAGFLVVGTLCVDSTDPFSLHE